jgi:hypothetical protein
VVEQSVLHALVEFADPLAAGPDPTAFVDRLCVRCTQLFGVDAAIVHLCGERRPPRLVAAAARPGAGLDAGLGGRLEELEHGAVAEALRTGEPVHRTDPSTERAPTWAPALGLPSGKATLLAVPLQRRAERTDRTGVLTLLRGAPPSLGADEVAAVRALADVAAATLAAVRELDAGRTLAGQLQHALDSRVLIEQAKGAVAARHALDVEEAFQRLRRYARNNHRPLRDVAREVLEGRITLAP